MKTRVPETIDDYIGDFPPDVQVLLEKVRMTIRKAAPKAEEAIKYRMPAFVWKGNLVYFAGYKHHIGFYPGSKGIREFSKELSAYKSGKGSVQLPLDRPVPVGVITKIVKFRVKENLEKANAKAKRRGR